MGKKKGKGGGDEEEAEEHQAEDSAAGYPSQTSKANKKQTRAGAKKKGSGGDEEEAEEHQAEDSAAGYPSQTSKANKKQTSAGAKKKGSDGIVDPEALPTSSEATAKGAPLSAASCSEDVWCKICVFLSLHEVARAALAFLSSKAIPDSIGNAWDPHVLLCRQWSKGVRGFRSFLSAAFATELSEHVFCMAPRKLEGEDVKEHNQRCIPSALARCNGVKPRSVAVDKQPSALAFGNGKSLLAIASGKDIKLIRRHDLKSCGMLSLQRCKAVESMAFSPDNSILAVVPMADSGSKGPEIQFYATEEKAQPVVTTLRSASISSIDFLHAGKSSGGACDLVVACNDALCQVSASTGDVVASWGADDGHAPFSVCQAVGPHEVITLADRSVEIWDLRTSEGVAWSVKVPEPVTALDAHALRSSSVALLGDNLGALHRMDWRGTDMPASDLLWSPPKELGSSLRSHKVMAQRGCVCLLAGPYLTMLAIDPCITALGWANATELNAVAAGHGAWAFATNVACGKNVKQSRVVLVESRGEAQQQQVRNAKEALEAAAKKEAKKEKEKKVEKKGAKPSSGKKASSGRMSCGR